MRLVVIFSASTWLFIGAAAFWLFGSPDTAMKLTVLAELFLLAAIEIYASMEDVGATDYSSPE